MSSQHMSFDSYFQIPTSFALPLLQHHLNHNAAMDYTHTTTTGQTPLTLTLTLFLPLFPFPSSNLLSLPLLPLPPSPSRHPPAFHSP
jgi:hypothetical protein